MSVDPGTGTYGAWISYSASYAITLPTGNSTKTVRVQYRDTNGNVTTKTDTIILDQAAPTGTVTINGGAAWTNPGDYVTVAGQDYYWDGTAWQDGRVPAVHYSGALPWTEIWIGGHQCTEVYRGGIKLWP